MGVCSDNRRNASRKIMSKRQFFGSCLAMRLNKGVVRNNRVTFRLRTIANKRSGDKTTVLGTITSCRAVNNGNRDPARRRNASPGTGCNRAGADLLLCA